MLLEARGVTKRYGSLAALSDVSFEVAEGEILGLIGPNGAGKTTFVNLLTGVLAPSAGRIYLDGEDVTGATQAARVKRGIGRTFQINSLLAGMSALDNVALGVAERHGIAARLWQPASNYHHVREEARELLASLGIGDDADTCVSELAYGKQRLVEIAIALGLKPRVLLLDEPAAGVPALEAERVLQALAQLPADIAILIIEHDMGLVYRFAQSITVLVEGAVLCEGTPAEIDRDPRVRRAYLGELDAG